MHKPILAVTGDTHGEEGRFLYPEELANKHLQKGDYLFICGDFGYLFDDSYRERQFLKYLAEDVPYTICFCDGNHENFDLINAYDVTTWNGGKVHIIKTDENGTPKVIHLMRGQVYEIEGKQLYAQVFDAMTEPLADRKPEVHEKYLDVQFLVTGREKLGFTPDTGNYEVAERFDERDLIFYKEVENEGFITSIPGCFCVFFPTDVHRPQVADGEPIKVRKVVVKVSVDLLK